MEHLAFILIKDYFDDTVKSPRDIQDKNINILTWIPEFEKNGKKGTKQHEFIILDKPDVLQAKHSEHSERGFSFQRWMHLLKQF